MMVQSQKEKYNIAWFKLAEFVQRRQKEKTFAIFKLLSHSLSDQALIFQLEGDLHLSFGDPKAINYYIKAAQLYEENKKYIEAASTLEHVLKLDFTNLDFINHDIIVSLIRLYLKMQNNIKVSKCSCLLSGYLIKFNKIEELVDILEKENLSQLNKLIILEYVFLDLLEKKYKDNFIYLLLDKIFDQNLILEKNNINIFLDKIKIINSDLYDYALAR